MKLSKKVDEGIYIIAEMSANHGGKLENALSIVRAAKDAGADCLKIQTYTPGSITIDCDNEYFRIRGGLWDGNTLNELYSEAATPFEWQPAIKAECDRIGIDFLSTPFDKEGADFLEELGVGAYKIASFELVDIPLIRHVAKKGKPMLVSCGMGTIDEIHEAVDTMLGEGLTKDQIILMKCTSEYPADLPDMNLVTIQDMIARFGVRVGFSDHSIGTIAPVAAIALGARVVEKHLCLSRDMEGPDSKFSTEPAEFAEMVHAIREAGEALGETFYGPTVNERESVSFRRSIFAIKDIQVGEIFTRENVRVIRPGHGLKPKYYDRLIGEVSKGQYDRGMPIAEIELSDEDIISDQSNFSIRLRNIEEADLKKIMNWRMQPSVTKYMYTDPVLTMDTQKTWFESIRADDTCKYWIIVADETDIGVLGIVDIDERNRRCNRIWYIGEDGFRGRGIAKRIQLNLYDYVFNHLNLHKVFDYVLACNEYVIERINKPCGYRVEGRLKDHVYKNGEYLDVMVMGITEDIWASIRGDFEYEKIKFEEQ
jgi:pseudaminic acid synthase/UDP-4-amino-4,6-dideoxy-N-acetyl-beta-L-altrosamine N-acetyltransferase